MPRLAPRPRKTGRGSAAVGAAGGARGGAGPPRSPARGGGGAGRRDGAGGGGAGGGAGGARPPAPAREAEARVGAEQRGEEAPAELRIAALRGEDLVEQLLRRGARRAVDQVLVEALPQKLKKPFRLVGAPGAFSRMAMARTSAEDRPSSIRCRSSNCSSSRRRRSRNCTKARVQRASNSATAPSPPRTSL